MNQKSARNQIIGSVVMGLGMGMLEEAVYDRRTGHPINNDFADYMIAVKADVPDIECIFLDYPDTIMNEYGACGIGEIGLNGCASALASATFHATGVRVRELPIHIEKLMARTNTSAAPAVKTDRVEALAPLPQLLPNLDQSLHLPRAWKPAVDQPAIPVGLIIEVPNRAQAEVCKVVPEFLQVLFAQDVHLLAIGTPGHGKRC